MRRQRQPPPHARASRQSPGSMAAWLLARSRRDRADRRSVALDQLRRRRVQRGHEHVEELRVPETSATPDAARLGGLLRRQHRSGDSRSRASSRRPPADGPARRPSGCRACAGEADAAARALQQHQRADGAHDAAEQLHVTPRPTSADSTAAARLPLTQSRPRMSATPSRAT